MNIKNWNLALKTLTIFRHLQDDLVFSSFTNLLDTDITDTEAFIENYCGFVSNLYQKNTNWTDYLYQWIINDENVYVHQVATQRPISPMIQATVKHELMLLEKVSQLTSKEVLKAIDYPGFLPQWETSSMDFYTSYQKYLEDLPYRGYGMFSKYRAFCIQNGKLVGVSHPDPQRLSDLIGYEREREQVIKNTLGFLQGLDANNVLLYGDACTGKSSTVKAIVNEYYKQGLRLIEIKKDQLYVLPDIMDSLVDNPLHFILFIDDLSFKENDDDFIALKNILEGGIAHNQKNCVVYATSNRRHFVQENMRNRDGGEIFRNDSIQETMSLAARFGLTVTFSKPLKDLYLEIVMQLADSYGIQMDRDELAIKAEAYAIRHSGRSPRTAKQFIESTKIDENTKN